MRMSIKIDVPCNAPSPWPHPMNYSQRCGTSGIFREGFWGSKPLPFLGFFFNLLGFLRKKSQNPPKFSPPYKKISKPLPRKISGYAPVQNWSKNDEKESISQLISTAPLIIPSQGLFILYDTSRILNFSLL